MSEDLQRRLQAEVDASLGQISRDKLRPLQKSSYLKMAACFDNTSATDEQMQRCLQTQQALLQNVQTVVQNELNRFQDRLQRCSQSCQDDISYQVTTDMDRNSSKFQNLEKQATACITTCVDKHIALLKSSIVPKIKSDIDELVKKM